MASSQQSPQQSQWSQAPNRPTQLQGDPATLLRPAAASLSTLGWPQLGATARPDAAARPAMAPPGTPFAYQQFQTSSTNQWVIPPGQAVAQRPPFIYPANFLLPYQRPDSGIQGFRPMADPFAAAAAGHPLAVWGAQQLKEFPDLHAGRTPSAVTMVEKLHLVSDSKSDKTSKVEVSEEDSWAAHKTEDGVIYYYNSVTGESTYEKPANFKGEASTVTSQPTPVSWGKLPGTDWVVVTTNDGKNYYYNPKTKETSWQVPAEVVELGKKKGEEALIETPAALTGGREANATESSAPSALDAIKKKLQEPSALFASGISEPERTKPVDGAKEKQKENDAPAIDSSSDSDHETSTLSKEECILQFKEMLKENGIAPFSKWEKELPKILFDPRFKAISNPTERRAIFEHYVRTRAEEERKEKRAKHKAAVEGFRQLLDEVKDISQETTYDSFAKTWGEDPRFQALERKERENLLNERVTPLRKAEEERVRKIQEAAAGEFKAMLKEANTTVTSRWSKVKDKFRDDPRYTAIKREDREGLFDAYIAELRAAELEAERAAKLKRDEENKLREKEREMRKRKEREEHELERVRTKARRKDAVTAYQALLTEKIKDPEASWTESRPKLERDPLGRFSSPELDLADLERLFRDHVKELNERCEKEYRALLSEVIISSASKSSEEKEGKDVMRSWSDAKEVLSSDPRYNRMPRRGRESLWRRHVEDLNRRLGTKLSPSAKRQRM